MNSVAVVRFKRYTKVMGYLEHEDLIGHDAPRNFLARSLNNKRHHAFLFVGSEHLGKDTVARAFVSDVLGRPVKEWQDLAIHPDATVLTRAEGEKNIGIEAVRGFINHFFSSSFLGGRKVGVICGAQDLSLEAANALLKTLEEPSGNSLLILVVNNLNQLPETIKSRCQMVRFLQVPPRVIKEGLMRRGLPGGTAEVSAAFSAGRPGLAITHANNADLQAEHEEQVAALLKLCQSAISRRISSVAELTNKAEASKLAAMLDVWIAVLRDALSVATANDSYASHIRSLSQLRSYVAGRSVKQIVAAIRATMMGKRALSENINPRLIFENIAFSL